VKIAYFRGFDEEEDALIAELARRGDVTCFVDESGRGSRVANLPVVDLAAVHYRNVLFAYDVVVYRVSTPPRGEIWYEAMCEWPGVALVGVDDVEAALAGHAVLRRALCERSLVRVTASPRAARWLHDDNPWIPVILVAAAEIADAVERAWSHGRADWLRTTLEAACAELPGRVPADPSAPWRAEVDELAGLLPAAQRMK